MLHKRSNTKKKSVLRFLVSIHFLFRKCTRMTLNEKPKWKPQHLIHKLAHQDVMNHDAAYFAGQDKLSLNIGYFQAEESKRVELSKSSS